MCTLAVTRKQTLFASNGAPHKTLCLKQKRAHHPSPTQVPTRTPHITRSKASETQVSTATLSMDTCPTGANGRGGGG